MATGLPGKAITKEVFVNCYLGPGQRHLQAQDVKASTRHSRLVITYKLLWNLSDIVGALYTQMLVHGEVMSCLIAVESQWNWQDLAIGFSEVPYVNLLPRLRIENINKGHRDHFHGSYFPGLMSVSNTQTPTRSCPDRDSVDADCRPMTLGHNSD
jgi:hypothetical protein